MRKLKEEILTHSQLSTSSSTDNFILSTSSSTGYATRCPSSSSTGNSTGISTLHKTCENAKIQVFIDSGSMKTHIPEHCMQCK